MVDEAHLLLQHINLIDITKEFDKVTLISATADNINHLSYFRDYIIVNQYIYEKYNRKIYINKLIADTAEQSAAIVGLNRFKTNELRYDISEDRRHEGMQALKELLKDRYKVAFYTDLMKINYSKLILVL